MKCLKFLAAQFLTDRSSSDAVPDLAHHTHGRRRKAASRILERRKRDRGGGAEQVGAANAGNGRRRCRSKCHLHLSAPVLVVVVVVGRRKEG